MDCALSLRSATDDDADAIARLSAQLGYPSNGRTVGARLERILSDSSHLLVVAESNTGVAGWLHAFVLDSVETPRRVQINGLVIDEEFRRKGVARRLVEYAEAWALSREIRSVGVSSNVRRTESHLFYQELGFEVVKTQVAYRKQI